MQKYFCDICGAELPNDYERSRDTTSRAASVCGAVDTCPSCAYIGSELDVPVVLLTEWRRRVNEKVVEREAAGFRGRGGEEKREIFSRLSAYRKEHGLGELVVQAKEAGVSEFELRSAVDGGKLPMETWRAIGKLLEEQ